MAKVINNRTNKILVDNLETAKHMSGRLVGLLGRTSLPDGHGLLLKRSGNSIHTFFMKFTIDVAFMDSKGTVKHLAHEVKPWRLIIAPLIFQTDCLELPAGTLKKTDTQKGDSLRVEA
ncbi:MAG: DUF192 domain-containing protein [Oligoflexia bacterium]|nr:DUF192 domain-containing protein [Oligoflexia bacterium]